jgi:hypothetical protein
MLKLYRLNESQKEYWETWEDNGSHVVHFGELGTQGTSKPIRGGLFRSATSIVQKEIDTMVAQGFAPVALEDHAVLMIEYPIDGMGNAADIEKRHALENRMNETLGWTGLGACDGGSIGSGTMEVCNFVVDFDVAKRVIETDLANTEFADFTRIYKED